MKRILKLAIFVTTIHLSISSCTKSSSGGNNGGGGGNGPSITSISPTSGITGDPITINGSGFSQSASSDTVIINGIEIAATAATSSSVSFNVPTGVGSGTVNLKIGSTTITGPNFTYNTSTVISLYAGGTAQGDLDGALLTGEFHTPRGLSIDMNDNVYVADNYRVREVSTNGTITSIAGQTSNGLTDGAATSGALFEQVTTLASNPGGDHIYIGDEGAIRLLTGGNVSTIAGTDVNTGVFFLDAAGTAARFNDDLTGMWLDNNANNIYVADAINARIRVVSTGGNVSTLAGNGTYGAGGSGTSAAFGNLISLTGDGLGNLFAVQTGTGSEWSLTTSSGTPITGVLRVTYTGLVTTLAGTTSSSSTTDGDTSSATFNVAGLNPPGVTLSLTGSAYDKINKILYIAYGVSGFRVINLVTGQVSTIVPRPDTRTVGVSLINSTNTTIGTMVEDSKGDLIVCDGSWLYKIAFNQ
jgi:hypothetical protein